jgi:tetratricopeptide (TPR) repeat protein
MFKARLKPSEQGTLERRYEFHLGEAVRAALLGDHEKAAGHSRTALAISRKLYTAARDPARQRPGLAAALAGHACYQRTLQAVELLTESAGHYAALAEAEPHRYEAERVDVLLRVALAADMAGNTKDAIRLLREVVGMYRQMPSDDEAIRGTGLARACFHLGRCLLAAGDAAEALSVTGAGLEAASSALGESSADCAGSPAESHDPGWLARAPQPVQSLAPEWLTAATRAMTLHATAGQWTAAAAAAAAAVRVSGGLAALGSEAGGTAHEALTAQARAIWARVPQEDNQSSCASVSA